MLDRLRRLTVFATVAELGSFSKAVMALEAESGRALLYRSTRRLALTDHGAQVLQTARPILRAAEAATDLLTRADSPSGVLRITCPAVLQDGPFIADLTAFARGHPRVKLEVEFTDTHRHLLRDGFDLALRIGESDDSALRSRRIIGGSQVLVAAPGLALPDLPGDLAATAVIGQAGSPGSLRLTRRSDGAEALLTPAGQITVDSSHATLSLARIGAGVALLPRFLAQPHLASGALVQVYSDWALPAFDIHAVWPANAGERSLTRLFLTFLLRRLVDDPPLHR